jgi:hypothetical protein
MNPKTQIVNLRNEINEHSMIEPAFTFHGKPIYYDEEIVGDKIYFFANDEDLTDELRHLKYALIELLHMKEIIVNTK